MVLEVVKDDDSDSDDNLPIVGRAGIGDRKCASWTRPACRPDSKATQTWFNTRFIPDKVTLKRTAFRYQPTAQGSYGSQPFPATPPPTSPTLTSAPLACFSTCCRCTPAHHTWLLWEPLPGSQIGHQIPNRALGEACQRQTKRNQFKLLHIFLGKYQNIIF